MNKNVSSRSAKIMQTPPSKMDVDSFPEKFREAIQERLAQLEVFHPGIYPVAFTTDAPWSSNGKLVCAFQPEFIAVPVGDPNWFGRSEDGAGDFWKEVPSDGKWMVDSFGIHVLSVSEKAAIRLRAAGWWFNHGHNAWVSPDKRELRWEDAVKELETK